MDCKDWLSMEPLHQNASCPKRPGEIRFPYSWEKIRGSIPSQTVSSFIKDTFHKQSWYFRQDMGRQSLTVYNNFQTPFFNGLPKSESHYKTHEVFMWCSEQGKFRVRVDISHLACCLTTFHKPTLTFRKWKWKWQNYQFEDPQSKKGTTGLFERCHLSGDTGRSTSPDILVTNFVRSSPRRSLWA